MTKEDWKLIGICGIYCGDCPSYLASRKNDVPELEFRAREMGCGVEEVRCDGCHSDRVMKGCQECTSGFRSCAWEHGVTWCFECPELPCQRLEDFKDIHVENGISHHEHLVDELLYLKEQDVDAWLAKKDREGRCPQCGEKVYWKTRVCPDCGAGIR